ncbi:CRISPR-associated protein Cas4 [Methanocella arvoryzae]|uniref:CRISPR-associated protein Cas4 n=1 Tax=Methanocella arvoryzae TaxID=1175445 RepID=UPI000324B074|nr:Dna2/Cas4 domain-containing protein [Methanocella arvoryzae]
MEGFTAETVRSDLLREISISLHSAYSSAEPQKALEQIYERACEDLAIVYGLAGEKIRKRSPVNIDRILAGLQAESARLGREKLSMLLKSEAVRLSHRSDKLRLSGAVDRIVAIDGRLRPVVISASQPPENGIYGSDRIRLAAYSMLVSDRFGCEADSGFVEYMGGWCIREAEIRPGDRREALSVRRRIEESRTAMPDARRGRWCHKCSYKERCTARVSFLDSLFGNG